MRRRAVGRGAIPLVVIVALLVLLAAACGTGRPAARQAVADATAGPTTTEAEPQPIELDPTVPLRDAAPTTTEAPPPTAPPTSAAARPAPVAPPRPKAAVAPTVKPAAPRPLAFVPPPPGAPAPPTCAGRPSGVALGRTIVCMAASPTGKGYWLLGADGGVFTYGDAGYFGSLAQRRLNQPMVAMAVTPTAKGYWLVGADGGVSGFGDADFHGAAVITKGAAPIVGAAATSSGKGYWLVAGDGSVYPFGDARNYGDLRGRKPAVTIVGMATPPDGKGYWLAGADGGVFSFGSARFRGAATQKARTAPVVSITATRDGGGYWLASGDGGVFTFGNAPFHGSAANGHVSGEIVSVAAVPDGSGYWLGGLDGGVFTYGSAPFLGSAWTPGVTPTVVAAGPALRGPVRVGIFYYPWYASVLDGGGRWLHWDEGSAIPPDDVGSDFFPERGVYSSADPNVIDAQMADIALTGVDTVITSWWGRGSFEDSRLADVARATAAHGLALAVQLEPYPDRSAETVSDDLTYLQQRFGVREVYVFDAEALAAGDWAAVIHATPGLRMFATGGAPGMVTGTFQGWAREAGFDGIYTYTGLFPPDQFVKVCQQAHTQNLLCLPSVTPGYKATHATGDTRVVERNNGGTYDAFWNNALASGPDGITITSYNEWHEGTQIEAAAPHCTILGFCSSDYESAYGTNGSATATAYLGRTKYWVERAHKG